MSMPELSSRGPRKGTDDVTMLLQCPRFACPALALFVCTAVLMLASPARAQEGPAPTLVEARVLVDMNRDGNNSVEATYTIEATDGLEDNMVEHLIVNQPGAEVGDITVDNGDSDGGDLSDSEGISRYRVSVSGDPVTYTLRYEVRTEPQTFALPVAVPDVAVAQPADSDIELQTMLPEGESLTGEVFPTVSSVETRNGRRVLVQSINNVPSRVVAQYGEGNVLGVSTFTSAAAVLLFGVVLFFWYRRTFGGESR